MSEVPVSFRVIGKGSSTIPNGVSQLLLTFTRKAGERILPPGGFITTTGNGYDIGWSYDDAGGNENSLQFYVRNTNNANEGELVCRNGQGAPIDIDWVLLGVLTP